MATKLLDISFWQATLDFAKIKKAGYDNIILRAGYGTTIATVQRRFYFHSLTHSFT